MSFNSDSDYFQNSYEFFDVEPSGGGFYDDVCSCGGDVISGQGFCHDCLEQFESDNHE